MKTYDQLLTETTTTKAISIAARLKGGINRLKAKMPGTQANKIQKINKRTDPKTYHESELGPNAVAVQKTRKSLGIKEAIKTLGYGSINRSASGKTLTMKTTDSTGKVSTKKKSLKELDHEDDIEYAIRTKAPAKPVKEAEASPKPEPKKVNRLKYFLDRAKKKETFGESETNNTPWTHPYSRGDYKKGVSLATDQGGYVSHGDIIKHTKLSPPSASRLHGHLKKDGHINGKDRV